MWAFLKSILLSIITILLLHYGWEYVKNNYSIRKTKELVKIQTEKYDIILSELVKNTHELNEIVDINEMENDLISFLETQYDEKQMYDCI